MFVEIKLKIFVGIIDAKLFKTIFLQRKKNIQQFFISIFLLGKLDCKLVLLRNTLLFYIFLILLCVNTECYIGNNKYSCLLIYFLVTLTLKNNYSLRPRNLLQRLKKIS